MQNGFHLNQARRQQYNYGPGNKFSGSNPNRFNRRGAYGGSFQDYRKSARPDSYNNANKPSYQHSSDQQASSFDNLNQLWMGDLEPSWDEKTIKKIWQSFGESPTSVKIIKDKFTSGNNKARNVGYCFVSFPDSNTVASALQKNGLQIPGSTKTLKLNWASGSNSLQQDNAKQGGRFSSKSQNDYSIFVGDLGMDVSETLLFESFNRNYPGQIKQVKIMIDPVTKLSKGFGFVKFASPHSQQKALTEMNGYQVGSRSIRVGMASGSNMSINQEKSPYPDGVSASQIQIPQYQPPLNHITDPENTTLRVDGLPANFTPDDLALHFINFGNIVHCHISPDHSFGLIKFLVRTDAEKAMLYAHGAILDGCRVKVTWGKNDTDSQDATNTTQNTTKHYKKSSLLPPIYGRLGSHNIMFDRLLPTELKQKRSECFEESEPMSVQKSNQLLIDKKNHSLSLLDFSPF